MQIAVLQEASLQNLHNLLPVEFLTIVSEIANKKNITNQQTITGNDFKVRVLITVTFSHNYFSGTNLVEIQRSKFLPTNPLAFHNMWN